MIETKVSLNYDGVLELGYLAENNARCFIFDISDWQDCFEAGGSVTLLARRPWDDDCYPCVIETVGTEVRWTVKNSDVAVSGTGRIVLQYKVGDTVVRSKPFSTHIALGIGGDLSKVPPAQQPWVQEVLNAKTSAEQAADEAKRAAESVKTEIFIAEYGITKLAEIVEAASTGKVIFCKLDQVQLVLVEATDDMAWFTFAGLSDDTMLTAMVTVDAENHWKDNIKDFGGGTFIAEYGVTTHEEIKQAFNDGRIVFARITAEQSSIISAFEILLSLITVDDLFAVFRYNVVADGGVQAIEVTVDAENHWNEDVFLVTPDVLVAEYGVTQFTTLWNFAVDTGRHIVVRRGEYRYELYRATATEMEFRAVGTDSTLYCRCTITNNDANGTWSYGEYQLTPESINAIPGYKGDITSGDLDDYTTPGNYRIPKIYNASIANTPFTGDTGTFLRVIPFNANAGNPRLVQEAFTNKIGGVDRKWRTKSLDEEKWSPWQDSCEVYIATYDTSINKNQAKIQEMWNLLLWKFGKSDDGLLTGSKTVFCRYPIWDSEKSQYEYHMIPLSKITPNYASFRGMTSDSTMRIVHFYNTSVSDSTKWGWSTKTQSMVTTTNLQTQITNLEKRIAALEGGDVT